MLILHAQSTCTCSLYYMCCTRLKYSVYSDFTQKITVSSDYMYLSGQHNYNICFWSLFLLLDTVCYIYTSGTTGLPKAVPIKQIRYVLIRIRVMMNTNSNYNYACIINVYSINGSECRFSQFE